MDTTSACSSSLFSVSLFSVTFWFWFTIQTVVYLIGACYFLLRLLSTFNQILRSLPSPPNWIKNPENQPNHDSSPKIEEIRGPEAPTANINNSELKVFNAEPVRQFTYKSLADATQGFKLKCRIGTDGLGAVYKGRMVDTNEVFTIRRLGCATCQKPEEFVNDVLLLSQANHPNLAKLIGYYVKDRDRFLVYKYEPRGTLKDLLRGNHICLDWEMRMEIALGVAKALDYLQNFMKPPILHCYIEPCNIWFDEEWTPKLSAFGVASMYTTLKEGKTSIIPRGSYYYGMIEYNLIGKLTPETDIHGFGLFLMEMITGRPPFGPDDDIDQKAAAWAQPYFKEGVNLVEMADPRLQGKFDKEKMCEALDIGKTCLEKRPFQRPPISDVVKKMELLVGRQCLKKSLTDVEEVINKCFEEVGQGIPSKK